MKARTQLRKNVREEGFTLIELLIVIVILGILAAIVVFAVGGTRKDAVANSCKTDVKSIDLSAEAVNTKSGKYPSLADLTDSTKGGLLKNIPGGTAPATDDYVFTYTQTGSGTGYSLAISGANVTGTGTGTAASPLTQNATAAQIKAACEKP